MGTSGPLRVIFCLSRKDQSRLVDHPHTPSTLDPNAPPFWRSNSWFRVSINFAYIVCPLTQGTVEPTGLSGLDELALLFMANFGDVREQSSLGTEHHERVARRDVVVQALLDRLLDCPSVQF